MADPIANQIVNDPTPIPVETTDSSWSGLSIGAVIGHINYSEPAPTNMREYGFMEGVNVGYYKLNASEDVVYHITADLLAGQLKYDGGSIDTATNNAKRFTLPTSDWLFDARGTIGAYRLLTEQWSVTPYLGVGLRDLNDKAFGPGSYNRNISYLYLPIGVSTAGWLTDRISFSLSADWEYVVSGLVQSKFSDVDPSNPDIQNHDHGYGYRVQVGLRYEMGTYAIHFAPFFQKWSMADSDHVPIQYYENGVLKNGYLLEPNNQSDYAGAEIGVDF